MPSEVRPPLHRLPRMPFASPASESIDSFATPVSLKSHKTYRSSPRGRAGPKSTTGYERAQPCQEVAMGVKTIASAITSGHEDESARAQPPQLNVITNFTARAPMTAANLSRVRAKDMAPGRQESLQVRRNMSRKIRNRDGMKGPIGSLRRADSKVSELSPSDATLLIGISIPSSNYLTTVNTSKEAVTVPQRPVVRHVGQERIEPLTPEIIITAAKLEGDWLDPDTYEEARAQVAEISSINTQTSRAIKRETKIPKLRIIPPFTLLSSKPSLQKPPDSQNTDKAEQERPRIESWGTTIDEEYNSESPIRSRPHSGESQLVMLKRSSLDTNATRHRSKGWWNQILSPFLERSNTIMTRKIPVDASKKALSRLYPKREVLQSPYATELEEDSPRTISSSTWTDISRWEAERRTMGFADYAHLNLPKSSLNISGEVVISPDFEPVAGFGAASEYYEACWHDQNSPTPFFHCQNHDCSQVKSLGPNCMNSQSVERDLINDVLDPNDASSAKMGANNSTGVFRQTAANRFSAAFAEVRASIRRPTSGTTVIEEDLETTPAVEEARAAPVVRTRIPMVTVSNGPKADGAASSSSGKGKEVLRTIGECELPKSQETSFSSGSASSSKPTVRHPASLPLHPAFIGSASQGARDDEIKSPEAVTPHYEQTMASREVIGLKRMPRDPSTSQRFHSSPSIYNIDHYFGRAQASPAQHSDSLSTIYPPPPTKPWSKGEEKRWLRPTDNVRSTSEDAFIERPKAVDTRLDLCEIQERRERIENRKEKNKKRRCLYILIFSGLLALIALTLGLTIGLTRQHIDIPVQSSWLNITGYPPMPTGIATIAQPSAAVENDGCVQPSTMWSCALPKEEQESVAPNAPDQPNYRIEIRYNNATVPMNATSSSNKFRRSKRHVGNAVSAGFKIRDRILNIRDTFTDTLYTSAPSPPSSEDQVFLGNTTDNNSVPFDGEYTPFSISFLSTTSGTSKLRKRQSPSDSNTTDPFPNITQTIPAPDLNSDGTAAAANLLPYPSAQPIRLYNRGQSNEHYGFYNYFDRSIFLKSATVGNSASGAVAVLDDENGGSPEDAATVRCTWAQTRFLVQIWTNLGSSSTLLSSANSSSTTPPVSGTSTPSASNSSANDFSRPGSFPYPVTITLDRHGGDIDAKMLYCYTMDNNKHIIASEKQFQLESRGFGGTLVNPAEGVFGNVNVTYAQGGPGGIDGGTGGCSCQWRNWIGKD
ncbi:hypothetical protein MMC13_002921 [Lambiella insularis]|nr:hypothetical protein [Lambiella insularis]